MEYLKLCDSDYRFMTIVWDNAPVSSGALVKLCNEQLGWKKSTTFDGSLPGFLTAFLGGKKISKKEAEKIKQIIDDYSEK